MRHTLRAMFSLGLLSACAGCATGVRLYRLGMGLPAIQVGYVDAGSGVSLFYRAIGTGRDTVVVLHGGPGFSMSYLAANLEPLAVGRVLIFYDQRGSGKSTLVSDSAALDARRFADDLEAVRAYFKLRRLRLLAHSWGAGVVALYASRYPDRIERLLVVDGISPTRALQAESIQRLGARRDTSDQRRLQEARTARLANPGDAAACRAFLDLWFAPAYSDISSSHRSNGDFCDGTPEGLANKANAIDRFTLASLGNWDWRPVLRRVNAPALIIHGADDYVPLTSAREWVSALPNAHLLVLKGSGHFPYVEVPDRFFVAAEEFLHGGRPAGASLH